MDRQLGCKLRVLHDDLTISQSIYEKTVLRCECLSLLLNLRQARLFLCASCEALQSLQSHTHALRSNLTMTLLYPNLVWSGMSSEVSLAYSGVKCYAAIARAVVVT